MTQSIPPDEGWRTKRTGQMLREHGFSAKEVEELLDLILSMAMDRLKLSLETYVSGEKP